MTNDEGHADALKAAVITLRRIRSDGCSAELDEKLDSIMYSIEVIIDDLEGYDE